VAPAVRLPDATTKLVRVAAALAVAVLRDRDSEEPPIFANAEERAAGQVALRFATLDRSHDAIRACELTAGELRRKMRCDRAPRPSGLLEYGHDEPFTVIGAVSSPSGPIHIHLVPGQRGGVDRRQPPRHGAVDQPLRDRVEKREAQMSARPCALRAV